MPANQPVSSFDTPSSARSSGNPAHANTPRVAPAAVAAVLILLVGASFVRNLVWEDGIRLWSDAVMKNPSSARAFANLGISYWKKERTAEAVSASTKSLQLMPNGVAYNTLGNIFAKLNRDGEAIEHYTRAIELQSGSAQFYNNRGIVYFHQGNFDRAIEDYTAALGMFPQFMEAYMNRGNALDEKGLTDAAIADYNRALDLDPGYADAYYNRGVALRMSKRLPQARRDFEVACSLGSKPACRALDIPEAGALPPP